MERLLLSLRSGERTVKLAALSELCELLSLATEDILHSFPPRELARGIMEVLRDDSESTTPHIKLMAIRCLNNFMAALPSTITRIASVDSISPLCDSVRSISYIDVAEEALLALGRIAKLQALPVLQAGGFSAILTNLDFFPIRVQHSAMETAWHLALEVNASRTDFFIPCIPQIGQLLRSGDKKVQTQAISIWAKISCSLAEHKGFQEALLSGCTPKILPRILEILEHQARNQGQSTTAGSTSRQIFRALANLCKHSSKIGEALISSPIPGLTQSGDVPAIALLISKLLDPEDTSWVSSEKRTGLYNGAISDILELAVELCPKMSVQQSGGDYSSSKLPSSASRGKSRKSKASDSGSLDLSFEVKGSHAPQIRSPLPRRKRRSRGKTAISAARKKGRRLRSRRNRGKDEDVAAEEKIGESVSDTKVFNPKFTSKFRALAISVAPALIRIGRDCDQANVRSLCVLGLRRVLEFLNQQLLLDGVKRGPGSLPGVCEFLVQLLRSDNTTLACSAIKISSTLLDSAPHTSSERDGDQALQSFSDLFYREGVFTTILELSKKDVKLATPTADGKFSFLGYDKWNPHPKVKLEAIRFIQSYFGGDANTIIAKAEDELLMARKSLELLANSLEERIPMNDTECRRKFSRGVVEYQKDAAILEEIRLKLDSPDLTTYELLSSGLIQKLALYVGVNSAPMPESFEYLACADPTSEQKYINDCCLLLRRATVLKTLLAGDSKVDLRGASVSEKASSSIVGVPVVERLIRTLEAVEAFSIRLDRKAASDPKAAVDLFAKPLRLNISKSKKYGGVSSENIKGQFAVDPLTTIGSIAKFLARQTPSLLLPPSESLSKYFTPSKLLSTPSSSSGQGPFASRMTKNRSLPVGTESAGKAQVKRRASSSRSGNGDSSSKLRRSSRLMRHKGKIDAPSCEIKSKPTVRRSSRRKTVEETAGKNVERKKPLTNTAGWLSASRRVRPRTTSSKASKAASKLSKIEVRSHTRSGTVFRKVSVSRAAQSETERPKRGVLNPSFPVMRSKRKVRNTRSVGLLQKCKRQRTKKDVKSVALQLNESNGEHDGIKEQVFQANNFADGGRVEISLNGHVLSPSCSVFEAVRRYGTHQKRGNRRSNSSNSQVNEEGSNVEFIDAMRAWEISHNITFRALPAGSGDATKKSASHSLPSAAPELKTSSEIVKELIMLVRALNHIYIARDEIRETHADLLDAEKPISKKETKSLQIRNTSAMMRDTWTGIYSAKISGKLMRQLSDPMVVCSTSGFSKDSCDIGIPEWGHWFARQTPFLLSPAVRYLYFKVTGFGSSQHLKSIDDHLKTRPSDGTVRRNGSDNLQNGFLGNSPSVPLEYRVKHVKVFCRRANTLEAACQLLEHHAADRCSIRAEFTGENGVGLGPTVEFFSLASRELQLKNLGLWRDINSELSSRTINSRPTVCEEIASKLEADLEMGQGKDLENDALHFVVWKCPSCNCVALPSCPKHKLLFTRICPDGKWACADESCEFLCSSGDGIGKCPETEHNGPVRCKFCRNAPELELEEWGLTEEECKYLTSSYPKRVPVFPHLSLKCYSCGCINFPGNNGILHANSGGRMISKDRTLVSETSFRNAFVHALKCCVGSLLHQHPLTLLENEFIIPLKSIFATTQKFLTRNSGKSSPSNRTGSLVDEGKCQSYNVENIEYVQDYHGLFPAGSDPSNQDQLRFASRTRRDQIVQGDCKATLRSPISLYMNVGRLMAQAVSEERVLDADFSPTLLQSLAGEHPTDSHLNLVDPKLQNSLKKLRKISRIYRHQVTLSEIQDQKVGRFRPADLTLDGCPIKDLMLFFVAPGTNVELLPNGENIPVTLENLESYLRLVYSHVLVKSVVTQLTSIRNGFKEICSPNAFSVLTPLEKANLVGGESGKGDRLWDFSVATLRKTVVCSQGYNISSSAIGYLFEILAEMNAEMQRSFIRFLTGCPRLPAGQLASLRPKITIVRVPWLSSRPNVLPLASTCTNYLKLPDYPNKELMQERIYYSIRECPFGFQLS